MTTTGPKANARTAHRRKATTFGVATGVVAPPVAQATRRDATTTPVRARAASSRSTSERANGRSGGRSTTGATETSRSAKRSSTTDGRATTGRSASRRTTTVQGNGTRGPLRTTAKASATAARTSVGRRRTTGAATTTAAAADNRHRSVLQPGETPRTRGERTRQRVAEALIELVGEGDRSPTAKAVAERAGVSVRLVFHHFADMDALYGLAVEVQAHRHWAEVHEVPSTASLDERVERTVQQRAKVFEAVSPVRQALVPIVPRNPEIAEAVAASERRLRDLLDGTFSRELQRAGRARKELLDALDASASWEAWDRLRRSQHLAPAAARKVVTRTLLGLLGG